MVILWPCQLSVEDYAAAGKAVVVPRPACPRCGSQPIFWSGYFRSVRAGTVFRVWVKRCRCKVCRRSDSLLPSFCLAGRLDAVEVIGPAVKAVSEGAGTRRVAEGIDGLFAYTTVRGWWRRHRQRSAWLWKVVSGLSWWPASSAPSGEVETLAALEVLAVVASVVVGISLWPTVSLISGGVWLSTTTDVPTTAGWGRPLMTLMGSRSSMVPP